MTGGSLGAVELLLDVAVRALAHELAMAGGTPGAVELLLDVAVGALAHELAMAGGTPGAVELLARHTGPRPRERARDDRRRR